MDCDAIGILVLDSGGKLKQDKVGPRSTGKDAAIGGALFLLARWLSVGVIGGTAAGALDHKNLGLSDADEARLTVDLNAGKAAVGCSRTPTARRDPDRLTQLGGASEAHELSDEALEAAGSSTRDGVTAARPTSVHHRAAPVPAIFRRARPSRFSCPRRRRIGCGFRSRRMSTSTPPASPVIRL